MFKYFSLKSIHLIRSFSFFFLSWNSFFLTSNKHKLFFLKVKLLYKCLILYLLNKDKLKQYDLHHENYLSPKGKNELLIRKTYDRIVSRFHHMIPFLSLNKSNVYFFWYFFNKDYLINIFLNLTMKDGKKYLAYKHIYKSFFFFKKLTGLQPINIIKQFLSKTRFLFDITYLILRRRIITIPKMLSMKAQITKSLKFLFNSFFIKNWKVKKKETPFYKKISYLMLSSVFYRNRLKKRIKRDRKLLNNHYNQIKKEIYFSKYSDEISNLKKKATFKVKWKSITKKMKWLNRRSRFLKPAKLDLNSGKSFLFTNFNINLQSKLKLKCKWF